MRDAIVRLQSQARRMIGLGKVTRTDDAGDQQLVQVNINPGGPRELEEVIDDVPRLGHYGLAYCLPDGGEVVIVSLGGHRSMSVGIATGHRETRPRDLQPGEAMVYNALAETFIKLCADGTIRSKGAWLHEGDFSATGDILDHSATNTATMKIHRDKFNVHKHGGVTAGGSMTAITDRTAP